MSTPFWKSVGTNSGGGYGNYPSQKSIGMTDVDAVDSGVVMFPKHTTVVCSTDTDGSFVTTRRFFALKPNEISFIPLPTWSPVTGAATIVLQPDTTSFIVKTRNIGGVFKPIIYAVTSVNYMAEESQNGIYIGSYDLSQGDTGTWTTTRIFNIAYSVVDYNPDLDVTDDGLYLQVAWITSPTVSDRLLYCAKCETNTMTMVGSALFRQVYEVSESVNGISVINHFGNNFFIHADGALTASGTDTSNLYYGAIGSNIFYGASRNVDMVMAAVAKTDDGLVFCTGDEPNLYFKIFWTSSGVDDLETVSTDIGTWHPNKYYAITTYEESGYPYLAVICFSTAAGDNKIRIFTRPLFGASSDWTELTGIISEPNYPSNMQYLGYLGAMHIPPPVGVQRTYYGFMVGYADDGVTSNGMYFRANDVLYTPTITEPGNYYDGEFPQDALCVDIDQGNSIGTRRTQSAAYTNLIRALDSITLVDGTVLYITDVGVRKFDNTLIGGHSSVWAGGQVPVDSSIKTLTRFRVDYEGGSLNDSIVVTWHVEGGVGRSFTLEPSMKNKWIKCNLMGRRFKPEIGFLMATTNPEYQDMAIGYIEADIVKTQDIR